MRDKTAEIMVSKLVDLLREERKRQDLSYQKLGELSGLHRTTISLIERGKQNPTVSACKKLAVALNVSLAKLIEIAETL